MTKYYFPNEIKPLNTLEWAISNNTFVRFTYGLAKKQVKAMGVVMLGMVGLKRSGIE